MQTYRLSNPGFMSLIGETLKFLTSGPRPAQLGNRLACLLSSKEHCASIARGVQHNLEELNLRHIKCDTYEAWWEVLVITLMWSQFDRCFTA